MFDGLINTPMRKSELSFQIRILIKLVKQLMVKKAISENGT